MRTAGFLTLVSVMGGLAALNPAIGDARDLHVVTSIKPVHSLVSGVMSGIGESDLLLGGASSPHTYSLKPSQARSLQDADVIFWVGEGLETFLAKPLDTLGSEALIVTLEDAPGLTKLKFREGGTFDEHEDHAGHDDHDEDDHDDHADHADHEEHEDHDDHADHADDDDHEDHDDHADHADHEEHEDHDDHADHADDDGHEEHDDHADHASHEDHDDHADHAKHAAHDDDDHEGHDAHEHGEYDAHIWLDPVNAGLLVNHIASKLSELDPDNAARYTENAAAMQADLQALTLEVNQLLEPVHERPFVVFHDAYHYFENRFGLQAAGSLTINPETMPGAARLTEIQQTLNELDAACVFSEPQFQTRIIDVAREGTSARAGVLDPLGFELEKGAELYGQLIRNMAASFRDCLAEGS